MILKEMMCNCKWHYFSWIAQ